MKLKQIITIFLLVVGASQVLSYENGVASSVSQDQENSSVASVDIEHSPIGHQHGCGDSDPCGHQCHFGHCGFAVIRSQTLAVPRLAGQALRYTTRIPPDSYLGSLFRPPLA